MEISLKQRDHEKYLTVLQVLKGLTRPIVRPFHVLRNQELEVFAILLYYFNEKYVTLDTKERNQLIFSYDTRTEICKLLGDVSKDTVYNIMMNLRKHGLITKKEIVDKYIIPNTQEFTLKFVSEK